MSEPYLSEIRMMGFNFPPKGWALCNGQLMSIQQNQALFSLLGTSFGGDGIRTFALPNLRGAAPLHFGSGPGGAPFAFGQSGGEPSHSLTVPEIAPHGHGLNVKAADADVDAAGITPSPSVALAQPLASEGQGHTPKGVDIYSPNAKNGKMADNAIGMEGGAQGHENRQPYLTVNFCIALTGIFPSPN